MTLQKYMDVIAKVYVAIAGIDDTAGIASFIHAKRSRQSLADFTHSRTLHTSRRLSISHNAEEKNWGQEKG